MQEQQQQKPSTNVASEYLNKTNKAMSLDNTTELINTEHSALLSHYHNLEKIGHGAQATMLKALDSQNHPVAIKVFDYSRASEWKDVELFEREIEVLKNLNIDGVPKYIETIKSDKTIYLVEEYIDASSIEKQMKYGRVFTTDECVTILERTAKILKKLSDCIPPIIHRDIKPANLLVDNNLNVWLVDFGVVANTQQTISMTFAGTAGYVAPEQLYGKSTPASDIFSLGATLLYLVSRVAPCDMQLDGITPDFDRYIPDTVPKWLSDTIKSMMSVDPRKRPQNGKELSIIIKNNRSNNTKQSTKTNSTKTPAKSSSTKTSTKSNNKKPSTKSSNNKQTNNLDDFELEYKPDFLLYDETNSSNTIEIYKEKYFKIEQQTLHHIFIAIGFLLLSLLIFAGTSSGLIIFLGALISMPIFLIFDKLARKKILKSTGLYCDNDNENNQTIERALHGSAEAQFFIGCKYDSGDGVKQDKKTANEWFITAAKQNHDNAQYMLALHYKTGDGIEKNKMKAARLFKNSAEFGNANAQYQLGLMYESGDGINKNDQKALRWYKKSALQGNADAQYHLGLMYENGTGTTQDYKQALEWYKKSAAQGHVLAQNHLNNAFKPHR